MQTIRTILADDHCIFLEGLKAVLSRSEKYHFDIIGATCRGEELLQLARRQPADLLILDLNLPDVDGLEAMGIINRERIPLSVLVLTAYDDPKIVKSALKNGASGYILKDQDISELFVAIEEVLGRRTFFGRGILLADTPAARPAVGKQQTDFHLEDKFIKKYQLTRRELEILRLITHALSNKEIARELFISDQTVSVHRKNIMRKLGVSNTAGLIKAAYEYSLV